jgi:tetratricopeptide (TPR) repeat protein
MSRLRVLAGCGVLLLMTVGPVACGTAEEGAPAEAAQPEVNEARAALSDEALAQLDSGNVAYGARALDEALRHYLQVTELAPDQASGWFGVYMAHDALGNTEAADSALARAGELAPDAEVPHPVVDSSGSGDR